MLWLSGASLKIAGPQLRSLKMRAVLHTGHRPESCSRLLFLWAGCITEWIFHILNLIILLFRVWSIAHQIRSSRKRLSLNHLLISVFLVSLVRLALRLCIYASVFRILTAIISDTKWLFSEGLALLHVVIASLWQLRGPPLHTALSHDSCSIYMFTLTISICCFWNNQQQGPGEKHRELL